MYHYDDRFYVSNCPTCKVEFATRTIREMKTLEEFHECGNAKLDNELGNVSNDGEDYLTEHPTPVEVVKPMFSTSLYGQATPGNEGLGMVANQATTGQTKKRLRLN